MRICWLYLGIGDQIRGTAMGSLGGSDQGQHAALAASGRNETSQGMGQLSNRPTGSTAMGTGPGLGAGTTDVGTGPVGSQPSGDMYRSGDAAAYPTGAGAGVNESNYGQGTGAGAGAGYGAGAGTTYGSGAGGSYGRDARPGQEQQFGTSVRGAEPQGYSGGGNDGYVQGAPTNSTMTTGQRPQENFQRDRF